MPGSISFLGLGSSQLNADLIDQLRTADEEIILGPVKRNAEKNVAQRTEFGTLAEKVVELKNASNVFSEDLTYLRREVDVSGSAIAVTTVDGVAPQKVAIEVNALAGNHVVQSKGFPNENSFIGLGEDETILVAIGSKEIEINTSPFTRIDGVRDAINDQFQGEIVASILDTGGDEGFRLILKARDSGAENEITFTLKAKESDVSSDSSVESAVEASDNEVKDDNGSKK
jgi:flagellar hook-associated protein 2